MTYNRPTPPHRPQQGGNMQRPTLASQRPVMQGGAGQGGGGNRGQNNNRGDYRGGGGDNQEPSPWLDHPHHTLTNPNPEASFVEYLRWMRSLEQGNKDGTKLQILQLSEERANYAQLLAKLTERTKRIAGEGNYLLVQCPWRIRVGGHRGPESILLPAFDALGMPFIPASTLRGVARAEALRELGDEKEVEKYFGGLDAKEGDRMGKIVFLDAYPVPSRDHKSGGLTVDMANNIWAWEGDRLSYAPNPNPFLSLQKPIFVIGIRAASTVSESAKQALVAKVMSWLTVGLKNGAGSQVNSGYGALLRAGESDRSSREFLRVEFGLEGQLIHGRQKFTQWQWNDRRNEYQMRGQAEAEVRPIAFKSMLRYWFRAFALGIISANQVKEWEGKLFGSLEIQGSGWVQVRILEGEVVQKEPRPNAQGRDDKCGEQAGILTLSHSMEPNAQKPQSVEKLFRSLTWLMFNLGGIGQGARRPCYSRKTRDRAPWYRGSTFFIDSKDAFWKSPDGLKELQKLYQSRIKDFTDALRSLNEGGRNIPDNPAAISRDRWREAVDGNCRIVICGGEENYGKPFALATLHSQELKVSDRRGEKTYDGNLCGVVGREVKPSPVWIADLGDYQVVTIFGVSNQADNPRYRYLQRLQTDRKNFLQIFPLV